MQYRDGIVPFRFRSFSPILAIRSVCETLRCSHNIGDTRYIFTTVDKTRGTKKHVTNKRDTFEAKQNVQDKKD